MIKLWGKDKKAELPEKRFSISQDASELRAVFNEFATKEMRKIDAAFEGLTKSFSLNEATLKALVKGEVYLNWDFHHSGSRLADRRIWQASGGYQNFSQELENIGIKLVEANIYNKNETSNDRSIQLQLRASKSFIEAVTGALHIEESGALDVEQTAVVKPQNKAHIIS
tara:strand:- start:143819 stop:144325 length:507 start_codon:yes stop_codon:yes gene_type:complete